MVTYSDDAELVEMDIVMLFWVVFRKQSIVLSYLPLANNFLSADESLLINVCRTRFSRASPVDIMGMRRAQIYIGTTNFEAALGPAASQVEKQYLQWQLRDVSAKDRRHSKNWTRQWFQPVRQERQSIFPLWVYYSNIEA